MRGLRKQSQVDDEVECDACLGLRARTRDCDCDVGSQVSASAGSGMRKQASNIVDFLAVVVVAELTRRENLRT